MFDILLPAHRKGPPSGGHSGVIGGRRARRRMSGFARNSDVLHRHSHCLRARLCPPSRMRLPGRALAKTSSGGDFCEGHHLFPSSSRGQLWGAGYADAQVRVGGGFAVGAPRARVSVVVGGRITSAVPPPYYYRPFYDPILFTVRSTAPTSTAVLLVSVFGGRVWLPPAMTAMGAARAGLAERHRDLHRQLFRWNR